jgi:hypothetical protein
MVALCQAKERTGMQHVILTKKTAHSHPSGGKSDESPALGRKNWLFIVSESAGKRTAVMMSLLATAKANGLNPAIWLTDTLQRLPTTKNKDINTLLPLKNRTAQ